MKKILVTGGAGFIGSNLIRELVALKYQIISIDNYSTGSKENELKTVKYIDGDIQNINLLIKDKIDICFHLAAQSRVQPSFDDPEESFKINVSGSYSVLDWARKNKVKVVYAGSSSKHHDPSDSPYAMTKFLGEGVCKLFKKSFNVDVQIARFYNVYGPLEPLDEKFGNVIGIWRYKVNNDLPLIIVGDGNQRRDFTHVSDIVSGLLKISQTDIRHDDAWELGSGVNYSIRELYKMFQEKFNVKCQHVDDQPGNYRSTLRTNDDMIKKLDWKPKDRLRNYINSL